MRSSGAGSRYRAAAALLLAGLAAACDLEAEFAPPAAVTTAAPAPPALPENPPPGSPLLDPGPSPLLAGPAVDDAPAAMTWGAPPLTLRPGSLALSAPVKAIARDEHGAETAPAGSAQLPFGIGFSLLPTGQAMMGVACGDQVGGVLTLTPGAAAPRRLRVACPDFITANVRFSNRIELLARQDSIDGVLVLTFEERRELRLYRDGAYANTTFSRTVGHARITGGAAGCSVRSLDGFSYRVLYKPGLEVMEETLKTVDPGKAAACRYNSAQG
ncbi:hypothetical protein [Zavarzinia compransoris]|uniref:Lipoprotein n=1 Tax=Zavarzinia compransoris TaxID=1264899 RepID=A0A317DX76_9PROT|nr:hypothetical protein [Zavarzinia compransoris]PWR19062.1 hypothetical protein DKG75_19070 [Zavarzinia compransoris]TDP49070.1 hypothetical protein DES42_101435 [Zavarzinia compransoris]